MHKFEFLSSFCHVNVAQRKFVQIIDNLIAFQKITLLSLITIQWANYQYRNAAGHSSVS